jgi:hypothetical protein
MEVGSCFRATGWLAVALLALGPAGARAGGGEAGETSPPGADRAVLDRVVAVVEGEVLTLSALDFEARLALVERGGVQAAEGPLDDETLRRALELAVSQRLQVLEAERLQAFPLDPAQLSGRLARLRARFVSPEAYQAFLERHEADEDMVQTVVARALRAERILDSRVRLRAQVSEAEVRRYYDARAHELAGPYETLRPALRDRLVRERYAQAAAAELARVRAGAQVKWVAPFAREGR